MRGHCTGGTVGLSSVRETVAGILTCTKQSRTFDLHESKSELP
nr:MAG TPA: PGAP1-like protein [Caudoviricetes sp.]